MVRTACLSGHDRADRRARRSASAALALTLAAPTLARAADPSAAAPDAAGPAPRLAAAARAEPAPPAASTPGARAEPAPRDATTSSARAEPASLSAPTPGARAEPAGDAPPPGAATGRPAEPAGSAAHPVASPAQSPGATEAAALARRGVGGGEAAPPYRLMRADEDYRYLRDPARRSDVLDVLKYIPLGRRVALGFGGETRQRLEWFGDPDWGAGPPRSTSWLQRYMLHADLRVPHARVFVQFKSGVETGRPGGPRPIDRDDLDVHQAFADLDLEAPGGLRLVVRAGRQELGFGSGRLVSPREGPNVRRSFDGVSLIVRARRVRAHLFVARPVAIRRGVLDDGWEPGQWFAGAYLTVPSPLRGGEVDVYALYLDRREAALHRGVAHERRLSLGTRWSGAAGPLDYNLEGVLQVGRFGDAPLVAWTFASDTGVRLPLPWDPRIGARLDIASGDRGRRVVGTFQALFPRGSYFGEDALFGPANFFDVHPSIGLAPLERLHLEFDWLVLWRQSLADGIYSVPGEPGVGPVGDARFIGHRAGVTLEVELARHVGVVFTYGRFFRGPFLVEAGRTRDTDFLATWLTLKF